jgi:hypothetical protein
MKNASTAMIAPLRLITSDHGLQELKIPVGALLHVPRNLKVELLLLLQKRLGHKFCHHSAHVQILC